MNPPALNTTPLRARNHRGLRCLASIKAARFKYHALPGGKAVLYDIEADPAETTDVQTQFPEITTSMAQQCRERWAAVLSSGRAFTPEPVGSKQQAE